MSRNERRIATLEERRLFLKGRIEHYRPGGDPSRDRAEVAALAWALQVIRAADQEGILDDLAAVAVAPAPDLTGVPQDELVARAALDPWGHTESEELRRRRLAGG